MENIVKIMVDIMEKIKNNLNICQSCGEKKDETLKICFYCYHRGVVSTVKMLLLIVLEENGKLMLINDVKENMNNHIINNNKKNFSYEMVRRKLKYLSGDNYGLIKCVQVKKKGKIGRPKNKYRVTAKGKRFLKDYLELWDNGYVPMKPYGTKKGKYLKDNSMEVERKARGIRNRMRAGIYEKFEFIFP